MRARTRDFIYTKDDLFFATTDYLHPKDRILSFLRYIPEQEGERSLNGSKYSKVDSEQAYQFLKSSFPDYLFGNEQNGLKSMGVPVKLVEKILKPEKRLKEILEEETEDVLLQKVKKITDTFHDLGGISYNKMGISGSILPGLYDKRVSDIDFVVYGLKNHQTAMKVFGEIKYQLGSPLKSIGDEFWMKLYVKRIKDSSLSYDEFIWYEKRKNNRGVIYGTLFDILATRDWDEIRGSYGDTSYQSMGNIKIECTISDSLSAYDNPAVYLVEDVEVIRGPEVFLDELTSLTHTYAGQVREGERVVAQGKLEKVLGKKIKYRLVVGTTRESINEYIKLKDLHI